MSSCLASPTAGTLVLLVLAVAGGLLTPVAVSVLLSPELRASWRRARAIERATAELIRLGLAPVEARRVVERRVADMGARYVEHERRERRHQRRA